MKRYTVKQMARLSGVSVRTLHHYDELGLLKPAEIGANGYRYYGREELLRLQQILLHRELEFPLEAIRAVLAAPGFDRASALRRQRATLSAQAQRYRRLIRTLDETLAAIEGETAMKDKDLYQGFAPEKQAEYEGWLVDRYGEGMRPKIEASKAKLKGAGPAGMQALKAECEAIEADLAQALRQGLPVDSEVATRTMRRHAAWVGKAWDRPPGREAFEGLADLYQAHPDFRSHYDDREPGLCDYMTAAMKAYAPGLEP
jgi:MerR family transcriptional regulator, thiopeptide resistance regulator